MTLNMMKLSIRTRITIILSITAFRITTLSIMTLGKSTLSKTKLSTMTHRIMTLK